eukprot:g79414.t1
MPPRKQTRSKGWRPHSKGKQKKATSATSKRHSRREKEVEKQTKRAKVAHEKAEKREAEEREIEEQETIEAEDKGASKGNVFYEFDGSQHRLIAEPSAKDLKGIVDEILLHEVRDREGNYVRDKDIAGVYRPEEMIGLMQLQAKLKEIDERYARAAAS